MPSRLFGLDMSLPRSADGDVAQTLDQVLDYTYMLSEQLRYAFSHLGLANFSEAGMSELSEKVNGPICLRLGSDEEQISSLSLTAGSLVSRMSDAEGSLASLLQRVDEDGAMISAIVRSEGSGYVADAQFILESINGSSGAYLSADKINFSAAQIMLNTRGNASYLALTDGNMMINSQNFRVSNYGEVECSSLAVTGGSIGIGSRNGQTVFSVTREGKVLTRGEIGLVGNGDAELTFMNGSTLIGSLSYCYRTDSSDYALYLQTYNANPVKIYSSAGLSLDCASGSGIYVGTAGPGGTVNIGAAGTRVNLIGDVYVNGSPL